MRIVRADGSIIEGTVAELAEFEALTIDLPPDRRAKSGPAGRGVSENSSIDAEQQDWEFVSTELAFRAMTRLKLSKQQKAAINLIYSGGENWTSAADIQREIGYTPSQFAGLMGAFGRRLVNTPGYVLNSAFFDQEWDQDRSCYIYRLPPTVRTAVETARLLD